MKSPSLDKLEVMRRQRTQSGRLTEAEVGRIKWHLGHGSGPRTHTVRELAKLYQMSFAAIKAIDKEESWGWVEAQPPNTLAVDNAAIDKAAAESYERYKALMGITDEPVEPPAMPQIHEKEDEEQGLIGLAKLTQMAEELGLSPQLDSELEEFLK